MKNAEDKIRTIRVRLSGFLTLGFLLASILTLILAISNSATDENGAKVYPPLLLNLNMLFVFAFVLCLILFVIFFIYRLKKRTTGSAMEMKPKETFKDDKETGSLIEKVNASTIPSSVFALYSYPKHLSDFVSLSAVTVLCLLGGTLAYFQPDSLPLAFSLYSLAFVSLVILVIILLLPLIMKVTEKGHINKVVEVYQDKMIYLSQDEKQEVIYYSSMVKARENRYGFCFLFYSNGEKIIYLNKKDCSEETVKFLSLKKNQIRNNNSQGIA